MEQPSQENLLRLRCCLCDHVLSVAPIEYVSDEKTHFRCGRCQNVGQLPRSRAYVLERVMKNIDLPCSYEDCDEKLQWDAVIDHENACQKKTIACPIDNGECKGTVQVKALQEHMNRYHRAHRYEDRFDVPLSFGDIRIGVLTFDKQQFFVMVRHTLTSPEVYVASVNDVGDKYEYNIKVWSNSQFSILIESQPIIRYDEREHCFNCLNNICEKAHHPYSRIYERSSPWFGHQVDMNKIKTVFGHGPIMFSIVLSKKFDEPEVRELVEISDEASTNWIQSTDLLKRLAQCSTCGTHLLTKIFHCENGHLICDSCRNSLTRCSTCLSWLNESRNFPLENVIGGVVLPCGNSRKGCRVTGKLQMISLHETECAHQKQDTKLAAVPDNNLHLECSSNESQVEQETEDSSSASDTAEADMARNEHRFSVLSLDPK